MRMLHPAWRDALAKPHPGAGPMEAFGPQAELSGAHATRPSSGRAIPPGSSTPEKDEHPSAEIGCQCAATVITSYSIHYTKLYETGFGEVGRRPLEGGIRKIRNRWMR